MNNANETQGLDDRRASEKPPSSFCHKFANVGLGTLCALFLISSVFGRLGRQLAKEGIAWVYYANGIVSSVLFLCCTACGMIALLGIIKHGRERLLWKGLVCMIPAIGFLAAALIARSR